MTREDLLTRLSSELVRSSGPVDIAGFVKSYFPRDVEAVGLLLSAFEARLVRGRIHSNLVSATGHISRVDTPTWH